MKFILKVEIIYYESFLKLHMNILYKIDIARDLRTRYELVHFVNIMQMISECVIQDCLKEEDSQ